MKSIPFKAGSIFFLLILMGFHRWQINLFATWAKSDVLKMDLSLSFLVSAGNWGIRKIRCLICALKERNE